MKNIPTSEKLERVAAKAQIAFKKAYQFAAYNRETEKQLVFIVGCQRSGTTLLANTFDKDRKIKIYREFSILTDQDFPKRLRLNPLPSVKAVIDRDRAPFIVMKPLVETQNIASIMDFFKGSKAIFAYRSYRDVACSDLKRFGEQNSISNIKPILERNPGNWRSEKVSENVYETVRTFFSETMRPEDAAALFWYARNRLYFDLRLEENRDVYLCKYEDLVSSPKVAFKDLYDFLGAKFPGPRIVEKIHSASVGKGDRTRISDEIARLCDELMNRLDTVYWGRNPRLPEADGDEHEK